MARCELRLNLLLLLLLPACFDDTTGRQQQHAYESPVPQPGRRLAVINTDYKSSALSLLNLDNQARVGAAILHSGSAVSQTSTALSGDVVLARTPLLDGRIALVDRNNAVVTLFAPETRQTQQISVSTGFAANPQDFAQVSAHKAYVTRLGRNTHPTATLDDWDEGDDVLLVDPQTAQVLGRIALQPYATSPELNASPTGILVTPDRVWVNLLSDSTDFQHQGAARLVALDPQTDQVVQSLDVPTGRNCALANYLPMEKRFTLVCSGLYADHAAQAARSAVVSVTQVGEEWTAKVLILATDLPGAHPFGAEAACVDGGHCLTVVPGDPNTGSKDALWRIEMDGGGATFVANGSGAFYLTGLSADLVTSRIYASDRGFSAGDVRVFTLSGSGTVIGTPIVSNPGGLGAVDLGRF